MAVQSIKLNLPFKGTDYLKNKKYFSGLAGKTNYNKGPFKRGGGKAMVNCKKCNNFFGHLESFFSLRALLLAQCMAHDQPCMVGRSVRKIRLSGK